MNNIGLIDSDSHKNNTYPNLALMKLSSFHKANGDNVEWAKKGVHYDTIYESKVFSFSQPANMNEYDCDDFVRGGSGFAISLINGHEYFDKSKDRNLPYNIEHAYPDYELYGIKDRAYGFMSRGCPRGCSFCHVKDKEGLRSYKVADLSEFWRGQPNIDLCDPNTLACKDWGDILSQLVDCGASVNMNQGVDIRLLTPEKADYLRKMKISNIHFAYDRYEDKEMIEPKFRLLKEKTGWNRNKVIVFVLTNYNTTIKQDLDRIMFLRSLNFEPYVMRYNKEHIPRGAMINALARWVNFVPLFWKYPTFEEYLRYERSNSDELIKQLREECA